MGRLSRRAAGGLAPPLFVKGLEKLVSFADERADTIPGGVRRFDLEE